MGHTLRHNALYLTVQKGNFSFIARSTVRELWQILFLKWSFNWFQISVSFNSDHLSEELFIFVILCFRSSVWNKIAHSFCESWRCVPEWDITTSSELDLDCTEGVLNHKTAFFTIFLTTTYNKKYILYCGSVYMCIYIPKQVLPSCTQLYCEGLILRFFCANLFVSLPLSVSFSLLLCLSLFFLLSFTHFLCWSLSSSN